MMWILEITEKELDFVFHENDEPDMVGSLEPEGYVTEVESLRTSLASRTHFEVLGFGLEGQVLCLEASSPQKSPCPGLEDSTIF